MLYGIEANLVDDGVPIAYNDRDRILEDSTYIVFDVETTGLSAVYDAFFIFILVGFLQGVPTNDPED